MGVTVFQVTKASKAMKVGRKLEVLLVDRRHKRRKRKGRKVVVVKQFWHMARKLGLLRMSYPCE